jgi:membrane protein YdbS with pleckstrin-like domain
VPLSRKFLNDDEEILVELRPHWVFFARPLFTAVVVVAAVVAILVAIPSAPNWVADALMVLAAIPVLWLAARLLRWATYLLVLTTTRIVVRRGVLGRNTVQIRLQRITEISLSQKLWERVVATGRLIVDVQGEDDAVVLEFVRKPAIVQRVINGQINELCGGGGAEPVPEELRHIGVRARRIQPDPPGHEDGPHTPPFGVPVVSAEGDTQVQPARPGPAPTSVSSARFGAAPGPGPGSGATASEIRDRLIELDDLRQRGIISEEEFAAKKAELLSRI